MTLSAAQERTAQRIRSAQIVPVLRAPDADAGRGLALRLVAAGLDVLELTATIPGWPDLVAAVKAEAPDAVVGLGTVRSGADAQRAVDRGADFLVSPHPVPGARPIAAEADLLFVEGGITPAEIGAATDRGLAKMFPAHLGGPQYLKSVLSILPGARIIPTGGIAVRDIPAWLDAGAFAVGVGSDVYAADDLEAKVAELRELIGAGRP
ncbi:bifunctional 4-hydroxy-2-oxoglutarate aldolase/2-dehydro-3-deoxy-phosphogluconate aldolase [Pseudonocardia acidicola]|uniref:Bifunctional 4-hydroxy-2-oxoglutarate aldolase/2-dehydro-3-deoxy-phosphogluconate aldolase n=1 Tax=Pseudonocardia acidicola TaxID=2724939 RepID=A0ABX1SBK9_9PSEU|nr:bifunctional 4-hydroxy-2-oxoglutarate aldolase/2-dehydro-3-deoxy-phosphogluconate aldolase [Pseudonocardia acidicola]NMH97878.1 bifunctional 4-hydroxy-2-oxoglutarate aldolase/2-dehydro-3-deoxy-phosphogluconate aldolase [Pseudonocardia acidicola]